MLQANMWEFKAVRSTLHGTSPGGGPIQLQEPGTCFWGSLFKGVEQMGPEKMAHSVFILQL